MYCLSSFCCVCLNDTGKLQDINQLDVDGLPLINKIIFVSFGHEAIDFKVVKYICAECMEILQLAYKFKRSCLVNHELLRMYSGQLRYYTGKVSEYKDLIVSLENLPDDKQEVEVDDDEEVEEPKINNVPPRKQKNGKLKEFPCISCEAIFHRHALLQLHYSTKHKSLFKMFKQKRSNQTSLISYACNMCSSRLASLYSLTNHFQLHKNKENTQTQIKENLQTEWKSDGSVCRFCSVEITNRDSYRQHLFLEHADRPNGRCNICMLTMSTDFHFRRHMFMKHTPKQCTQCYEYCFNNDELAAHIAAKHRTHKCGKCQKSFSHKKSLLSHMKSHEPRGVKNHEPRGAKIHKNVVSMRRKCSNCLSVFTSKWGLKKHRCFQLKNMFQCQTCLLVYSKKSSYMNHVRYCVPSKENLTTNTPEFIELDQIDDDTTVQEKVQNDADLQVKREVVDDLEIREVFSISEFPKTPEKLHDAKAKKQEARKSFPKIRFKQNEDIIRAVKLRRKSFHSMGNEELKKRRIQSENPDAETSKSVNPEISDSETTIQPLRLQRKTLWIKDPIIVPDAAPQAPHPPSMWDPPENSETPGGDPLGIFIPSNPVPAILKSLLIKVSAQQQDDQIVLKAQAPPPLRKISFNLNENCVNSSDVNENLQDTSLRTVQHNKSVFVDPPAPPKINDDFMADAASIISVRKVADINSDVSEPSN